LRICRKGRALRPVWDYQKGVLFPIIGNLGAKTITAEERGWWREGGGGCRPLRSGMKPCPWAKKKPRRWGGRRLDRRRQNNVRTSPDLMDMKERSTVIRAELRLLVAPAEALTCQSSRGRRLRLGGEERKKKTLLHCCKWQSLPFTLWKSCSFGARGRRITCDLAG